MSREDIKEEIFNVLDRLSDRALVGFLYFLKNIESKHPISLLSDDDFKRILFEDKELLQELAS